MTAQAPEKLRAPYFEDFQQLNQRLAHDEALTLILAFSDYGRFSCSACAACCQSWNIVVNEAYYHQWKEHWETHEDSRFHQAFLKNDTTDTDRFANLAKHPGTDRCVFLDSDNKCYIHKAHGEEHKPVGCQVYPRSIQPQFNGYSSIFLQKSCASAPGLMLRDPHIYYFLKSDFAHALPPRPDSVDPEDVFPRADYHLFLGLALDLLEQPFGGLISRYGTLGQTLARLIQWDDGKSLRWADLYRAALEDVQYPSTPSEEARDTAQKMCHNLVKWRFPEMMDPPPASGLTPQEVTVLNQYLWVYLRQKLITQSYIPPGQLFYDVLTHQVVNMCFLQMTVLYTRYLQQAEPLRQAHFERALSRVERKMAHQWHWIERLKIPQLEPTLAVDVFQALGQMTFE